MYIVIVYTYIPIPDILSHKRKILLLDGDILVKRNLRPLFRLEAVSAGKDCGAVLALKQL